jgi:hypothetical protein
MIDKVRVFGEIQRHYFRNVRAFLVSRSIRLFSFFFKMFSFCSSFSFFLLIISGDVSNLCVVKHALLGAVGRVSVMFCGRANIASTSAFQLHAGISVASPNDAISFMSMFHEGTSSTNTLGSLGKNCGVSMTALSVTFVDCPSVPLHSGEAGDGGSVFGVASHSWRLPSLLPEVEVSFVTGSGLSKTREGIISSFLNGEQEYG